MPLFILFTLGNIALNSHWTKAYLSGVLELRTGVIWEIGTLTIAPNGVLHVYALEGQLGDGGVLVKHISVRPNYAMALDKRLRFSEIYIEQPEITLTDEWILEKLETQVRQSIEGSIVAALETNASNGRVEVVASGQAANNSVAGTAHKDENSQAVVPVKKIEVTPNGATSDLGNHNPEDFYESWLRLRGAKLRVVSKYGDLLVIDGFTADIPTGGKDLMSANWLMPRVFGISTHSTASM